MVDSLLDKYYRVTPPEPPANDGGSLVDDLRAERDREIAFRLSQAEDPDKVARANVIARQKGIPAPLVDGNLSALEAQQQAEKSADILRQYPAIGRWSANPRNVGAASDDLESLGKLGAAIKSRVVRDKTDFVRGSGFFDRMGDLFTRAVYSLDQGAASLSGALQEWSANNPLPWTSEANLAAANRKSAENRAMARLYGDAAGTRISGETSLSDLRDRPGLGTLGGFVLDQGVGSIPGMAMAWFGLPLYVASQAGSIGQNRAQNDGREDATIGDVGVALPAAVVSAALERVGVESIFGAPGKKALTRILQAGAGEGSTEFLQSIVEYAGGTVGTEAGFDPGQALEQGIGGAIAGVGMGAGLRGGQEIVTPAVRSTFKRFAEADAAVNDANTMDRIVDAAGQTKLKGRDPEAFSALLKEMAQDSDIENVYVPAEALQSYMQSDGYDGSFDSYRDAVDDGILTGGDVVIPFEAAVSAFTGSPAWNALKDDVRLTPGGPSRREALTFDEAMADVMADLTGQMEADQKRSAEESAPREVLAQSLTDKLMNAGYTPSQARTNAELLTQKAATRAQRMGRELTGAEFDALQINQVLPERLAQAQKADEIDIVINAMKKGAQASRQRGASLLEYVAQQGGIEDKGGDLTSMGADRWHVGKPGKRKLIRETAAKGQGSMLGPSVSTGFGIDDYALRAWEAGYFPHHAERPTIQEFLDAVGEEMTGTPRYVDLGGVDVASQTQDKVAEAADELRALLENRGIDPDKATAKEIRKAIEGFANEQSQGVGYDQDGKLITDSPAFKAWFGNSKVVDASGKPLVVYHGTNQPIDDFNSERLGNATKSVSSRLGFFFTSDAHVASLYAENAAERVVSGIDEFERKSSELQKRADRLEREAQRTGEWGAYEAAMSEWEDLEIGATREENSGQNVLPVYLSIQNPKVIDFEGETILRLNGGFGEAIAQAKADGYDGLILRNIDDTPNESRASDHYVTFEPIQIKSVNNTGAFSPSDPRILYQSLSDGPRGRITFPAAGFGTGRTIIDLFQSRNSSTFLHEAGHMWLEELRFDASDPGAPQQLRDDWQVVQDWFTAEGHPLTDGVIPVGAHEMWARSVERYLMEGKAPVPALRKIFESIKSWLVQVYRTAAKLNAPINDDIRAVMDRLIATDEEIAAARAEQSLEAAFTEKPATMSDAEWDGYKTLASDARATAYDTLLAKTMNAVKRRVTKEYQDRAAEVRKDVAADIDARPEFRALAAVRARPIDAQWIREAYGPDATTMLPKNVPPVFKNGGANPDEVAELIGYKSGDEMVRALMGLETRRLELREGGDQRSVREGLIQDEVNAQMLARYGDPFTDGSIEEEALAAVHNEKQGELLAADLRILGRSAQKRPTPYSVAKAWAARSIREGKVSDMVSRSAVQRYRRAAQKAGKEALDAILEGAMEEAFQKKQAQMLNNALVSEATRVSDEVDKAVARLSKWAGKVTAKSIDQDYLERAQALLEQVDLRPRSQRSIDRQAQFEAWAQEQTAAGHDIVVPPSFAVSLGTTHWSRLSVDQLLGLDAAVEQIIHLGRFKQTLLDNKARRDFDEVRSEALSQMGGMDKRPPPTMAEPGHWDSIKSGVASADAALLKMETVFDWLDGKNPNGVFNRIVFRPIADAQHAEQALLREYITKVQELTRALPKETVSKWRRKFSDPRLATDVARGPMTRDQLIAIALNMGNASNRAKLTGGYGWDTDAVMAVLNENLSAAEWQYVQAIWDTIESLWPKIEAMEKRVNGVAPEKIEATTIETATGKLRGGYYPVMYDPRLSQVGETSSAKSGDVMFQPSYTRASTSHGFVKSRTDVEEPVWLSLGPVDRHLSEVIHDLTHREAIMQADKFLSDRRIAQAVDETLGPEVRRQFRPWLQHIANEWAYDRAGMGGAERFIRAIRRNTTFVGMGFRASTVMMQIAGFSDSTGTIGEKAMIHGLTRFSANPKQAIDFVLEKSGEVRSRMDTLDRDIREAARRHAGHVNVLSAAQRFGYMGIGWADRLVVVPTWIGAYDKALTSGLSEADAIYAADKAVRVSQGSGAAKDLAAIQRGRGPSGEAFKLLTMFYSYASGYYQRMRSLGRDVRRANAADIPNLVARSLWLVIVPALAAELLAGRGPDEDDEEGWGEWAFEKVALSMFNPIPIARDIAPIAWAKATDKPTFGYSFTPVARGFETIANVFGDLGNVVENEETKRATRNFLEATGYVTGVVPGQAATAAQFIVDIGYGEQDPQGIGEWLEGLQKGKVSED
jgi:hypothetical protein